MKFLSLIWSMNLYFGFSHSLSLQAAQAATYLFFLWSALCMLKQWVCQKITMTLWTDDQHNRQGSRSSLTSFLLQRSLTRESLPHHNTPQRDTQSQLMHKSMFHTAERKIKINRIQKNIFNQEKCLSRLSSVRSGNTAVQPERPLSKSQMSSCWINQFSCG